MILRPFARWLFMRCFERELRRIAREVRAATATADRSEIAVRVIAILDTLETLDLLAR